MPKTVLLSNEISFMQPFGIRNYFLTERLSHNRVLQTINVLLNNIHKIILKISFKDTNYIRNRPCYNQIQMLSIKGKYLVWTDVKIIKLHQ